MTREQFEQLPSIKVGWDASNQRVAIACDNISPSFALAILDMARREFEGMLRLQQVNKIQQAAQEQAVTEKLRNGLKI